MRSRVLAAAAIVLLIGPGCGGGDAGANGDGVDADDAASEAGDGALLDAADGADSASDGDDGATDADETSDVGDDGATDGATDGAADGDEVSDGSDDGATDGAGETDGGGGTWNPACMSCHGSANPAPPKSVDGFTATTDPPVGAHQSHLGASSWHKEVACAECHVVPTKPSRDLTVPTHLNGSNDLTWGPLALRGTYDATASTCASTYCHGDTLRPDKAGATSSRAPLWTTVDGTQKACGKSCHTLPPGGGHPSSTACQACHSTVISSFVAGDPPTVTWKDAALHIDGKLDADGLTCTSCHGDATKNNPAPPLGTRGELQTIDRAVGAHAQHLGASAWHRAGACADCHTVPTSNSHANHTVELTWGSLASTAGASPAFDKDFVTCGGVYCHGETLLGPAPGGVVKRSPAWTVVDGTYDACGASCHTTPPGGAHPTSTQCETCHGDVISSFTGGPSPSATWKDASRHVDGKIDVTTTLTCTSCHGNAATNDPTPPKGTHGETSTSQAAVGAHAQHLGASSWHRDGQCADCHATPASTIHSNGVVDFAWGALTSSNGAAPAFEAATVSCSGTYCHGTTLAGANPGGSVSRSPVWNVVNGSYDSCGASCHTNPPGGTHPQSTACASCHDAVVSSYDPATKATTWKDRALHVNGAVEVATLTCTTCHGDVASKNPAPPRGTKGETATTARAVGAHAAHLGTSTWHRDETCTDCHAVPASMNHTDGVVGFSWSALAKTGGATPAFDGAKVSCSGTYCHGATLPGANPGGTVNRSPAWTTVDGSQDACGSTCHTNPPGDTHPANTSCPTCHGAVISGYDAATKTATWKDRTLHVDGTVQVVGLTCTSCHGNSTTKSPAPPVGTKGETATSQLAVGAHQQHLGTSTWHRDGQCSDCHTVPASTGHANGATDFTWGAVATSSGATPAYAGATCNGTYCHGAMLLGPNAGGTVARAPAWNVVNGSYDACGSTCHTNPPGGTHPNNPGCPTCHGAVIATYDSATKAATWTDRTRHVNGTVEVAALTCTSCHGNAAAGNAAPPVGTKGETATSQKAVGAHQQHLGASTWHREAACNDCHTVPSSTSHSNGTTDFAFSAVAKAGGATPLYTSGTSTCTGAYCHGTTLLGANAGGSVNRSPVWNVVNGTYDACGTTCHTNPPGGTHPANTACATCHGAVIATYDPATKAATWTDHTRHVNGTVEVTGLTCTSCHGNAATSDPSPPLGTKGETATTQAAVGAHQQHLGASAWHRSGQCTDCHTVPTSTSHATGATNFNWGPVAKADGAAPSYAGTSCSGSYCHGATLAGPKTGGTIARQPAWNVVNGSYDACGSTCHTNPPGGTHPASTDCAMCHGQVIATFDAASSASTWANATLHVDGTVQSGKYHDLAAWTTPKGNVNHHGSNYFLTKQQKDEHGRACTECHGANLDGGTVSVSCNNASCHRGTNWRSCNFCHGNATQNNPPNGVQGETATNTLAVGRHAAHLTANTSHAAFPCASCHAVPATSDVAHAAQYVPTTSLAAPGHHGDVAFTLGATGTTWNVNATQGTPTVTARGTCTGACHSNGRGGQPTVVPYWAGGTWPTANVCGNCHSSTMNNLGGRHGDHSGENLTCAACHPGATATTHMDGKRQVNGTISGAPGSGSVTTEAPGVAGNTCSNNRVQCNGTCHGQGHSGLCW